MNSPLSLFQKAYHALGHIPDFGKTCKALLNAVVEEIDAEACSLMLKHSLLDELRILAVKGKGEADCLYYPEGSPKGKRFKLGEGIAGWVFKEGKALVLEDVLQDPRFIRANGFGERIRSLLCHPIREMGQVVGVLNLSHTMKGAFNKASISTIALSDCISQLIGAALVSTRFFAETHPMGCWIPGERAFLPQRSTSDYGESSLSDSQLEIGNWPDQPLFIFTSPRMREIKALIDRVANTNVAVFIRGESGTGKEVVARYIHLQSFQRKKPFIKIHCSTLSLERLEGELLKAERDVSPKAYPQKPDRMGPPGGGTIFLDEISEMSLPLQGRLLQLLQEREFPRPGEERNLLGEKRVLVSTNQNLEKAVRLGRFRADLLDRLMGVNLTLPPLRDRKEEIPLFVEYFIQRFSKKYGRKVHPLSPELMNLFTQYRWPGNIRELENAIQRIIVLGGEKWIVEEITSSLKVDFTRNQGIPSPPKDYPSQKEAHRESMRKADISSNAALKR